MEYQIHTLMWRGIEIEIRYNPDHFHEVVAHLEIRSIQPLKARLPITDTGFKSHYPPFGAIERDYDGDVVKAVAHWLNEEVNSKAWQRYEREQRQGELF